MCNYWLLVDSKNLMAVDSYFWLFQISKQNFEISKVYTFEKAKKKFLKRVNSND